MPSSTAPSAPRGKNWFSELSNFEYQRSAKQAIGFYLAYLVFIIILAGAFGALLGVSGGSHGSVSIVAGNLVAMILTGYLGFAIWRQKHLEPAMLGLVALAVVLGLLGGGILGLIPVAYLTTRSLVVSTLTE